MSSSVGDYMPSTITRVCVFVQALFPSALLVSNTVLDAVDKLTAKEGSGQRCRHFGYLPNRGALFHRNSTFGILDL